jgi:hypothetical protein
MWKVDNEDKCIVDERNDSSNEENEDVAEDLQPIDITDHDKIILDR